VTAENEVDGLKPKTHKPLPERPKTPARPDPVKAKLPDEPAAPTTKDVTEAKLRRIREKFTRLNDCKNYDAGVIASSAIGALIYGRWEALLAEPLFVGLRRSFGVVLDTPTIREWIAKPLPKELAALDRLPDDLKDDA